MPKNAKIHCYGDHEQNTSQNAWQNNWMRSNNVYLQVHLLLEHPVYLYQLDQDWKTLVSVYGLFKQNRVQIIHKIMHIFNFYREYIKHYQLYKYMDYISTISAYDLRVPLLLIPCGNSLLPLYTGKTWCLNAFHFLHCGKLWSWWTNSSEPA